MRKRHRKRLSERERQGGGGKKEIRMHGCEWIVDMQGSFVRTIIPSFLTQCSGTATFKMSTYPSSSFFFFLVLLFFTSLVLVKRALLLSLFKGWKINGEILQTEPGVGGTSLLP